MRRVVALGCLVAVGIFLLTLAFVGGWQAFESVVNPAVRAIHEHPVATTPSVLGTELDGPAGDPAVSYTYVVAGHTYHGYDIGSAATGNVFEKYPGDPLPIQYAATMPGVSCVAESTDCPNDVYDPYLFVGVFWGLMLLSAIVIGAAFGIRAIVRRLRCQGDASRALRSQPD